MMIMTITTVSYTHLAVQHFEGYAPLSIRGALVPVVNFGSMISWPLIIIGLFMNCLLYTSSQNSGNSI